MSNDNDYRTLYERLNDMRSEEQNSSKKESEEAATKEVREFYGLWKNLFPDMIQRALSSMTETEWWYEDGIIEDDSIQGLFYATVELRDSRPESPGLSQYCYDAAKEAMRKINSLRNQRALIKNNAELRKKLEEIAGSDCGESAPLNKEDSERLADALLNPREPNQKLIDAICRYKDRMAE